MLKISENFSGKVALVTGANRGIGLETSRILAEKGAFVYMTALNDNLGKSLEAELKNKGLNVKYMHMDVSNKDEVYFTAEQIIKEKSKIDILVHSAGQSKRTNFIDMSYEEWLKIIDINLNGTFLICQTAAKHMIKKKYGKIVIISSGSAFTGTGGGVHYASSKAGQIGLTRALANELSKYNINVNAVAPRTIKTRLLTDLYPTEDARKKLIEKIPMGRLGEAEDVANAAIFLSSDESSFITGQYVLIDGGRTFS